MKYEIFQFELPSTSDTSELNRFLASHRATAVSHYMVRPQDAPLLVFVVEYVDGQPSSTRKSSKPDPQASLSDSQRVVFNRLRDWRKEASAEAGLPVYNIINNAQLVEVIKRDARTLADLIAIPGIGKSLVEKHGKQILAVIADFQSPKDSDEPTSESPTESSAQPPTDREST